MAGPTISGYESGDSHITVDELPKFAAAFGVHPSEFFHDEAVAETPERFARGSKPERRDEYQPPVDLNPAWNVFRNVGIDDEAADALVRLADVLARRSSGG